MNFLLPPPEANNGQNIGTQLDVGVVERCQAELVGVGFQGGQDSPGEAQVRDVLWPTEARGVN